MVLNISNSAVTPWRRSALEKICLGEDLPWR
jgi:hypothetical protein